MNWYAYVGDDPTDRGDPTGESWQIFQGTSAPGYNPSSEPDAGTNDFTSFFGAIFNDGSQQSADTANAAPAGASEASGGTPEKAASPQNQCDGNATCQAFADQGLTSTQDPDLGVQKAKSAAEEKANGPDREKWGLGALAIIEAPELIFTAVDAAAGAGVARIATLFKGCGCFVAGTLVETDHGLRPIESIKVGDNVLSRDDVSGKTAFQSVTGLIRPHDRQIYDVRLERAGHHTAELFEVTDDHPWRTVDGQWLTTLQLNVGVTIQTEDGKGVQVVSIMATHRIADTYNLTVGDFHTFFVGHNEVWVHNACDPTELHHIIPKYLGGAKNGPLAAIPRSYHQLITNAFRRLAPYGKGPRSLEEVEEIVRKVYEQHPLP